MPRGDGSGPGGMGPMTGRGAGFCAGYGMPGYMNPMGGSDLGPWGCGRGGGRGWRHGYRATGLPGWARAGYGMLAWGDPMGAYAGGFAGPPAPEQEIQALRGQAEYLEGALDDVKKRIEQLEAEADK